MLQLPFNYTKAFPVFLLDCGASKAEALGETPDPLSFFSHLTEFAAYINAEMVKWTKVIKAAGIRVD